MGERIFVVVGGYEDLTSTTTTGDQTRLVRVRPRHFIYGVYYNRADAEQLLAHKEEFHLKHPRIIELPPNCPLNAEMMGERVFVAVGQYGTERRSFVYGVFRTRAAAEELLKWNEPGRPLNPNISVVEVDVMGGEEII